MAPRALLGDGPDYDNPDAPAVPDGAEALAEGLARMTAAQRGAMGFQAAASTWLTLFKGGCLEPGTTCHHYAVPPAQRPYEWGESHVVKMMQSLFFTFNYSLTAYTMGNVFVWKPAKESLKY
jgi:hypothetical protein